MAYAVLGAGGIVVDGVVLNLDASGVIEGLYVNQYVSETAEILQMGRCNRCSAQRASNRA